MKHIRFTSLIAGLLLAVGTAQTASAQAINLHQPELAEKYYQQGVQAWQQGDVKAAAKQFKDAYTFSDSKAGAMLGLLYMKGAGVFRNAEVARAYAIAVDQRDNFDAFQYYQQRWQRSGDADNAYLIAWVLANRFSGQAREDYIEWIHKAASKGHLEARRDIAKYLN